MGGGKLPKKETSSSVSSTPNEKLVNAELEKYEAISKGVQAEGANSRYYEGGLFSEKTFWYEHRLDLPIHYSTYVGQVGCAKAASSNVETVFSGTGGMVAKSVNIGGELLSDYSICHHNWQYEWLRPTKAEIDTAYCKLYGKEAHESDLEDDVDGGFCEGEESEAEAEDAEGAEMPSVS